MVLRMADKKTRALDALDTATGLYRETEIAHEEARKGLVQAVIAALKAEVPPTVVSERSPFTATHVRKLARENGVPPARPGIKPQSGTSR